MPVRNDLLRYAMTRPRQQLSISRLYSSSIVPITPNVTEKKDHSSVSTPPALQRQQLEFCCMLCGWDVACGTCPFSWYDFNPKKFRSKCRERNGDADGSAFTARESDIQHALKVLGIQMSSNGNERTLPTQKQVKAAFRVKALEWHPDCNRDPQAQTQFPKILLAYELLLHYAS
uniref:J domain-containing protein n=1 Tax=Hyaloperonospora arabidopsidis (strain Emoy2) TaxID=559515 RepID=M4B630_HYAAE